MGTHRGLRRAAALAGVAACLSAPAAAIAERLSLEGFTGYLSTPSAFSQEPGTAQLLFTDARTRDLRPTRTWLLSVGWIRYLELGGRITDVPGRLTDLSLNLKLELPLDLLAPRLPVAVAVGAQDEGGAAPRFRTRYAVASGRLGPLTASLGFGTGPDRMEGLFGGASLALAGWLELLAEWDTRDANAGLRLSVPLSGVGLPLRLGGMGRVSLTHEPVAAAWAATLEVPLWLNAGPQGREPVSYPEPDAGEPGPAGGEDGPLARLEAALVAVGFEEVRAGRDGATVVVEYENGRFHHAEADGLGVVLREAERAGLAGEPMAVVMKRSGLRVLEIALGGGGGEAAWTFAPPERPARWVSARPRNRLPLHARLVLAPGLVTFVATERGVLDFVLSFRPDLVLPLWSGATGFARADLPFAWSDDFGDGGVFRIYRPRPRLVHALLHQAIPLGRGLMVMVGAGVFRTSDAGGLAEVLWTLLDGDLALGAQGSWTADDSRRQHRAYTASARFRLDPLDLWGRVRGGRFAGGDEGVALELWRWFGDVRVGLTFTRTELSMGGVFLTLPLTPRRGMRPGWIQVRGDSRWEHAVGTVVGEDANPLRTGLGVPPLAPWNLESSFLDFGRVSRGGLAGTLPAPGPAGGGR